MPKKKGSSFEEIRKETEQFEERIRKIEKYLPEHYCNFLQEMYPNKFPKKKHNHIRQVKNLIRKDYEILEALEELATAYKPFIKAIEKIKNGK